MLCALGVLLGAFGAHTLEHLVSADRLQTWETGVRFQFFHGIGLLALGGLMGRPHRKLLRRAALILLLGVLLFSGSLYTLVLTGALWLGMVAPVGGVAMIGGWILAAFSLARNPSFR
jgi:uncharacterized membrane protein YgdD (TMEM256/DUF423 family)